MTASYHPNHSGAAREYFNRADSSCADENDIGLLEYFNTAISALIENGLWRGNQASNFERQINAAKWHHDRPSITLTNDIHDTYDAWDSYCASIKWDCEDDVWERQRALWSKFEIAVCAADERASQPVLETV